MIRGCSRVRISCARHPLWSYNYMTRSPRLAKASDLASAFRLGTLRFVSLSTPTTRPTSVLAVAAAAAAARLLAEPLAGLGVHCNMRMPPDTVQPGGQAVRALLWLRSVCCLFVCACTCASLVVRWARRCAGGPTARVGRAGVCVCVTPCVSVVALSLPAVPFYTRAHTHLAMVPRSMLCMSDIVSCLSPTSYIPP